MFQVAIGFCLNFDPVRSLFGFTFNFCLLHIIWIKTWKTLTVRWRHSNYFLWKSLKSFLLNDGQTWTEIFLDLISKKFGWSKFLIKLWDCWRSSKNFEACRERNICALIILALKPNRVMAISLFYLWGSISSLTQNFTIIVVTQIAKKQL